MPHNAIVGIIEAEDISVIAPGHPVMVLSGAVKQGQGKLQPGQLLAADDDGLLIAATSASTTVKGVNLHLVDTASEAGAAYVVHGSVNQAVLKVGTDPASAADLAKLVALTIYPV